MLNQYLIAETIQLDATAATWRQAVHVSLRPLEEAGAVAPAYAHEVIRMLEELGPYLVVAPGIALVHARPSPSIHHLCLSLVRLKSPVAFGSAENDPVDLLIGLGATDSSSHLQLLSQLMGLLGDSSNIRAIRQARSVAEVVDLVAKVGG